MSTTVFTTTTTSDGGGGGENMIRRKQQFFPVRLHAEYETISQRLVDAAHVNDLQLASELVSHPSVDVNFIGTVCLKSRKTEVVLNGESASEVRIEFEEFRTDVTALFLAAHNGNIALVRKLLNAGANVNQKLFRGYATTAAVREGHIEVLEMLLNCGAAQGACEEALLEASYVGRARPAELLMGSEMIRPHVAVHALVTASSRGFIDFVETLIKNGVDANANARILLQSSKPSLHANVDCNALVAAIVSRQVSVVDLLLKFGCRTDTKARLGAWSWDVTTGEEFRVGAGLAEPYRVTWCAVEYFEASGVILRMLLKHLSPNIPHLGRAIIHHAILCGNARAFEVLLSCGADIEFPVETTKQIDLRPIHLAARLGLPTILRLLINAGCNLNSRTGSGETALMICARHKQEECLKLLASAGADFGLTNMSGQCAMSIAGSMRWTLGFQQAVVDVIRAGKIAQSSNAEVFSSLLFVTRANDVEALKKLLEKPDLNLNEKDESGFSAVMVAAAGGHVEPFRLLVNAGADVDTCNKYGETALSLAEANENRDSFAKVLSAYAYAKGKSNSNRLSALHHAARLGNHDLVRELTNEGCDVNILDSDGYTPLMLAARSGDGSMCELLISCGAKCDIENARHETALSLASKSKDGSDAERVILDELARRLVLSGDHVKKHTKAGRGSPHVKVLKMVEAAGLLRWGKSTKRNVICRGAEVGPSSAFRWNRRKKSDADDPGVFRVVTTKNKEIHFSCRGGTEIAELWVRGIRLVTREAIFGRKSGDVHIVR
ncbi:Ankyrin repeat and SAM domain-containing protein 6 [Sesamum alatum]|uniref:Ankyrin repeat and SAM domain-containing protein 6 n=1 Tax=Sesamum alatum TaxID=300844 RepID=A0AAE2CJ02_9LAMI|nr:Ankyrin repeat and SAM domain-containing protein 6 [Sesamum alatum]